MTDNQFSESIKLIEYFQHTDLKSESLIFATQKLKQMADKDLILGFWNELEIWLKSYQDISEKHKALYNHVKKIRDNFLKIYSTITDLPSKTSKKIESTDPSKKASNLDYLFK